jgi:hypothetical protein
MDPEMQFSELMDINDTQPKVNGPTVHFAHFCLTKIMAKKQNL